MRIEHLCWALMLCSCLRGPASTTASAEDDFTPTGEVQFRQRSAAFNDTRVVGPNVNLSQRADGSWGGRMLGEPVDVNQYVDSIGGVGFNLTMHPSPEGQVVTGQWHGEIIRIELHETTVMVRTGKESFTLPSYGRGRYGSEGQFRLSGQAALASPPFPQFAFAMVGAFLNARQSTPFGRLGGWEVNPNLGNHGRD